MIKINNHNITISGNRIDLCAEVMILFNVLMREKMLSAELLGKLLYYIKDSDSDVMPVVEALLKQETDMKEEDERESFVNLMDGVFRRRTNND